MTKRTFFVILFLFLLVNPLFALEKELDNMKIEDPDSNRFLCKSQMGAFLHFEGVDRKLEGYAREGTDTFSIYIDEDKLHFSTGDKVLNGSFEDEPLKIVQIENGLIVAIQHYRNPQSTVNFGRTETIIFNKRSGLGSWIRNVTGVIENNENQDIQAYSFTCKSVN